MQINKKVDSEASFVAAKSDQKRRRPVIDTDAQDSDGNYVDQIALDSVNYESQAQSVIDPSDNYPASNLQSLKKTSKNQPTELKFQYVTAQSYSAPPKIKENYSSYVDVSHLNRTTQSRRPIISRQKQKVQTDYSDYNFYFPDSKRLNTKTPAKASTTQNNFDKFYQPQAADAVVRKEVSKNGDELTYHYYYPSEESTQIEQQKPSIPSSTSSSTFSSSSNFSPSNFNPSSSFSPSTTYSSVTTFSPSSTRAPLNKQPTKKNIHSASFQHTIEHTSTDPYQYPPVLQRPNEYELKGSDAPQQSFYPTFENSKIYKSQSTLTPSTSSPVKMLKPTKKNNYYLPSSTISPSTTAKPMKIRRPSTETQYQKYSLPPSISTTMASHYSTTTRAPELYKYSTASPISSTTLNNFYIKPSTQVTPTISSSASDLFSDGSNERTVVIKPKVQYNSDNYEQQPTVREKIVYKFVDPQEYYDFEANKTDSEIIYTPSMATYESETAKSPEYYRELNTSTQADMDFYNSFHKNYNYEYFTEQDAGRMPDDGEEKIDRHSMESNPMDDRQRASKKNMMFTIASEPRFPQSSMIPYNVQEHEVPPPMESDNENDLAAEASKNTDQYFVLYSVDDDNRRGRKQKKKGKPEQEVVYHHHTHQHEGDNQYEDGDFQQFDSEFDSEFDSDLVNSDNVRIVDPNVRGGRPLEFTKDDYLRHIKQAVVQYMKNYPIQKDSSVSSSNTRVKTQKYQESNQDHLRPTKASIPAALLSSTAGYKSTLGPQQYKQMSSLKLPKNVYTADKLKDAIDDMQESPHVDLTLKKSKVKPFDLSAIDVGQTYQHVTQFDHSAALKNVEEFDQSHALAGNNNKQKLHFSQQTYHDINNLGHNNQKQKVSDDNDNDNTYKGYVLPTNKYGTKLVSNQNQNTYSSMNYDSSKLPRIVSQNNDDDDDENKVDDTIDAPIQIINGIPVANPYNIDLNTLKYMLGGIAQAEVNDQIRDLDESSSQKFTSNWKAFSTDGSFTSNNPIYQVYGQQQKGNENPPQKSKKTQSNSNKQQQQQQNQQLLQQNHLQQQNQNKFPLVGTLMNLNKSKQTQQQSKQRNSNRNNNNNDNNNQHHQIKNAINIHDYSNWNQINKKQRIEPQTAQSQNVFVVRPMIRNKQARDDKKSTITRFREPARDMRPPPPLKSNPSHQQIVLARIK
ncbi:bromodomain-containing protein DDB_G0270170-like [Chironomus tepperi]|uniref:bromodomain-containing protein DDB_G0270170-like n=1 Tax=Chironomus tepperi TaxID=113505 RepID=UPI00391F71DC